uniref:ribonuclease H n=1 Tax=Leptobrachium leishanense TaxID=445787 RepID=A0A8C5PP08_9ANUR
METAQAQQKTWYDRSACSRSFLVGQKVLVLKPQRQNKLQAAWQGPYRVVTQLGDTTYVVVSCADTRIQWTFHVNMLKAYHERPESVDAICAPATEETEPFPLVELPGIAKQPSGVDQVQLGEGIGPEKEAQARQLLHDYPGVFSALPGYTDQAVHQVDTPGQRPLRQPAYRLPEAVRESMRAEIREMLELGVIEPSASPWASPVVLVPKKDGTTRFCVDYRRINDCTITDAYPMPRVDELLDQISRGHFLTTVDLCKGYWQIPLAEEATPKSAFITPFGLYQFRVMPFGMKNAPATFQRLIDCLLDGLQGFACAYLDDIAIYSQTWEEHLDHVGTVLGRIRDANLTLKPEKCKVGMAEVQYLGHRVGCGIQRPEPAKIEAILDWPTPVTKTQVLAFLGTAGYYRKFVPHYSDLAKPLTDLTKKSLPRQVLWSPECEQAFRQLKAALTQAPLLAAPNYNKRFVVHTDASMFGLGAVLSQVGDDGGDHPVAFISRKLLPREVGYAAVEKECLALVWALRKLQPYVYGRSFTVMTDHNPLVWLNRMIGSENGRFGPSGRIAKWSIRTIRSESATPRFLTANTNRGPGASCQRGPMGLVWAGRDSHCFHICANVYKYMCCVKNKQILLVHSASPGDFYIGCILRSRAVSECGIQRRSEPNTLCLHLASGQRCSVWVSDSRNSTEVPRSDPKARPVCRASVYRAVSERSEYSQ